MSNSLFNSEIISLLYTEGGSLDGLVLDLVSSNYLISNGYGYRWDEKTRLWKKYTFYDLIQVIHQDLEQYCRDYNFASVSVDKIATLIHTIKKDDWERKLNCKRHLYPIKWGKVLNLETLTMREREKSDYFSFECPVTYNMANYDKVERLMQLLTKFNSNNLRSIFGYFISGLTTKKCFYTFYGETFIKNYLINMLSIILDQFFYKITDPEQVSHLRGKRLVFFSDSDMIDSTMLDLLYHNSTCKYLLPTASNPQGQPYISIKLSQRHLQIIDQISPDDFFSWCVQGTPAWFQYRKQYIEN